MAIRTVHKRIYPNCIPHLPGACDVDPGSGDLGIPSAKLLAPGNADASVICARLNSREDGVMMPPLGSVLIREWINSPGSCVN
ncbi:MAG: hypothetical protein QGH93_06375 [Gammaproteobacteria bacterium]|jgi:hypothetical protein|nr:hypothetical protein [Gammaproteobacteria bacterium]